MRSIRVSAVYAVAVGGPKAVLGWLRSFVASGVWPMGRPFPPGLNFCVKHLYVRLVASRGVIVGLGTLYHPDVVFVLVVGPPG